MNVAGDAPNAVSVESRQCGRCRKLFEGDPALNAAAIPDWWACPSCRVSLKLDPEPDRSSSC